MSLHQHHTAEDIEVLREMISIAEDRRELELQMLENVNKYNLALIAFSGSFLSLLITVSSFQKVTIIVAGFLLIISIFISLLAISPRRFKGAILIEEDILALQQKKNIPLGAYLLATARVIEETTNNIDEVLEKKKTLTICSAISLFFSLILTYVLQIFL